jgi:hypothetical protein
MKIKFLKWRSILIMSIVLYYFPNTLSQDYLSWQVKNLYYLELLTYDVNKLLDHEELMSIKDSIRVLYWKDHYWFNFSVPPEEKGYFALFSYNFNNKKLYQVTCKFKARYTYISGIEVWYDQIFYVPSVTSDDSIGGCTIYLINTETMSVKDTIHLMSNCGFLVNRENDKIKFIIQKLERKRRKFRFWELFMIRGRPGKWDYDYIGNKWQFTFDRYLNLIEKKELLE